MIVTWQLKSFFFLILILMMAASGAECCTRVSSTIVRCDLTDVVYNRHNFEVDVLLNVCSKPVDLTFFLRSTNFSFNFTYVPDNQNERVYVPELYLAAPAHRLPTYLYVREPEVEYNERNHTTNNGTIITVQASLVGVYKNTWEEELFLNESFEVSSKGSCYGGPRDDSPMWYVSVIIFVSLGFLALTSCLVMAYRNGDALMSLFRRSDSLLTQESVITAPNGSRSTTGVLCNTPQQQPSVSQCEASSSGGSSKTVNEFGSSLKKLKQTVKVSVKMSFSFKKLSEENEEEINRGTTDTNQSSMVEQPTDIDRKISMASLNDVSANALAKKHDKNAFEYGSRDYLDELEGTVENTDVDNRQHVEDR